MMKIIIGNQSKLPRGYLKLNLRLNNRKRWNNYFTNISHHNKNKINIKNTY